jgi:hypothetical protein
MLMHKRALHNLISLLTICGLANALFKVVILGNKREIFKGADLALQFRKGGSTQVLVGILKVDLQYIKKVVQFPGEKA